MRPLEIIILLINAVYVVWGLFAARPKWLHGLPLLAAVLIPAHGLLEGARWQMWPAYGLTAVLLLAAVAGWRQDGAAGRGWRTGGAAVGLLLLTVAAALPALLPVPDLPAATGPYAVGTRTLHMTDHNRPEIFTADPDDVREIMVQIWYPATEGAAGETAVFLPALDVAGPVIAEQFDLPAFLLSHINLVKLNIQMDVPAAGGERFPVVAFSHGLSGIRMQNTSMMRNLASHGYVVFAVDHTYANALTVFPDGRVILYDPCRVFTGCRSNPEEGSRLVGVWAADIAFVLDTLAGWHNEAGHWLNGRLDLERAGVFGHSTGGGTAVEFCLQDERCDAGIGLDAWVLPVSDNLLVDGLNRPFMFISTPEWLGDNNRAAGKTIVANANDDAYELTLADTGHYDFTDLVLLSPLTPQLGLSGTINSQKSLTIQNEYVLTFFDRYLRGADASLLESPSPYTELTIDGRFP